MNDVFHHAIYFNAVEVEIDIDGWLTMVETTSNRTGSPPFFIVRYFQTGSFDKDDGYVRKNIHAILEARYKSRGSTKRSFC